MNARNKKKSETKELREDLEMYNQSMGKTLLEVTQAIAKNSSLISRNHDLILKNSKAISHNARAIKEFRSETIGRFADVMGELKAIREELTVFSHQVVRNSGRLDTVESKLGIVT